MPEDKNLKYVSKNKKIALYGWDYMKNEFLKAMSITGFISSGAAAVGVSRQTIHHWRQDDKEFDEAVKALEHELVHRLETEIYNRAVIGEDKKIYNNKGELIDTVKQKSDVLLMFMTKRFDPAYRDNTKVDVGLDDSVLTFFQKLRANRETDDCDTNEHIELHNPKLIDTTCILNEDNDDCIQNDDDDEDCPF